ncbi:hypothetical protein [Ruegeria sp. HKCCD6428]|uniref:hypothetical protein n=1 Tax=Ruegeria sp. HKCCD6428 TaxID=2683002 RepID=UPI001490CDCC|nr:hypothetical protein [Ruegeria sp. HKCCD6428]NOC81855.1 hypothetical protein [Ruegeria sp. HKCCD6428]
MSDNVVKAGIEDVLSSVKRLVSEDSRGKSSSDQQGATRKPGRLVLTDALRISKPAQPEIMPAKPSPDVADSAKPMLLRACDIVRAGDPANTADDATEGHSAETGSTDDPAISLSAKIEALEAAIAQTEDQWEPDGDSADAYSGTPTHSLPWNVEEEFAAARTVVLTDQEDTDDPQPESASIQNAEFIRAGRPAESDRATEVVVDVSTTDLDEETLRELIAEVVRQELQGAMGERITRNVRKMVRREIARALAAKDLG